MAEHIKCEYLGGNISVFCSDTHRFGTDAVMLEYFALNGKTSPQSIMDMGCGCGIIPMLFARDTKAKITALDIQQDAVALVERGIEYNGLTERMTAVCADLNEIPKEYYSKYDLVTMNPPYKRKGAGLTTDNEGLNIARFELKCTFDDVAKAAALLLKNKGRFCVCNRPDRLCDMMVAMREHNIEPKRMRSVIQRQGDAPMLVLLEGISGAKPDMVIEPPLYIEDDDGTLTKDAALIYEKWEYDRKNLK